MVSKSLSIKEGRHAESDTIIRWENIWTPRRQLSPIRLKGSLVSKGYPQIIHILNQDEDFHINRFQTGPRQRNEVQQYIAAFITSEKLEDTVFPAYT